MNASASPAATDRFLNIAAYKFVPLDRLEERRRELLESCETLGLRGTILLSPEGINLFLAGTPAGVEEFVNFLRSDPALSDLETKDSYSDEQPFRRMLVRLKKEIIAFGIDGIEPLRHTSPKLPATELKKWLDQGRPVRLLDVRNEYEIELGTFRGAEHLRLDNFRNFPQAAEQLSDEAKKQPVVMFCTGGIRCEKAGPYLEQAGFENVYQLEGGILKYFEECGDAHYDGACFVFDGRVALDAQLKPTGNLLCFACQAVLSVEDVTSDRFLFGKYCPHCYRDPDDLQADRIAQRQARIRELAAAQPGSSPYENVRHMYVPRRHAGRELIEFLEYWHPPTARRQWLQWIEEGTITRGGARVAPSDDVREGECFVQRMPGTIEPPINPEIRLLYEDQSLVVIHKPAPLPVHPSGRYNRNTLTSLLADAYPKEKLRIAHRIDANTTGLVVFCRRLAAARLVQPQFQNGEATKRYLCRIHGHPLQEQWECREPISRSVDVAGARHIDPDGLPAATHFELLRRFDDGTSLLRATPLSGRTHQIRVHLWWDQHPIVGDPLYLPDRQLGRSQTLAVSQPAMCLHAERIALRHPDTNQQIRFTATAPNWTRP